MAEKNTTKGAEKNTTKGAEKNSANAIVAQRFYAMRGDFVKLFLAADSAGDTESATAYWNAADAAAQMGEKSAKLDSAE